MVAALAEGQKENGTHVAAILPPDELRDHPFLAALKTKNVPVTTVAFGARMYLSEYRFFRGFIGELSPSIVHTHGYHADVIAAAAARSVGVATVSTVHGFLGVPLRNWLYERVQLLALRRAAAVMAVSRPLVERLVKARIRRDRIHLVQNGFALAAPLLSRSNARRALGIQGDTPTVGWVGRLSREKGADVMVEAMAACDRRWHLSMIGDGPERDRLARRAKELGVADRISWHGSVLNAGAHFTAFDAFVLSSRTEGTPIALLEAMHAGIPIVATSVGGVPDVLTNEHAIVVPPERPAAIAESLNMLMRDQIGASERASRARMRLTQAFGRDGWLAAVDAVYSEVERDGQKS